MRKESRRCLSPYSPWQGKPGLLRRTTRKEVREPEALMAGVSNVNGVQISRCFSAASNWRRVHQESRPSPVVDHRQPPLASDESLYTYSQNVAGLWLKYGVKSRKIRDFPALQNSRRDPTVCRKWALTRPMGGAYNPATERGTALAPEAKAGFCAIDALHFDE
jgi:hypothetical protein